MNENVFDQEFYGQTTLAPLGALALIMLGLAMLIVPRRYAVFPMLVMACFVSPAQRIVVFSLNFDLLRIMVLVGTLRVLVRGEWSGFRMVTLDWVFITWSLYSIFAFVLLYFKLEPLKYKLGLVYDAMGMYFLFRMLVRDWRDIDAICNAMAILAIPILGAFLVEYATRHNPFAALGGVPPITPERGGRLRCQGAFAHPILAGCFWACGMPLLMAQWWRKKVQTWLIVAGLGASGAIIVLCSSSTPASAVIMGTAAFLFFFWRRHLRWFLVALVVALIALQIGMNHPIWWLLSYVDFVGGSTGWFRYNVMQQAVDHMDEWWIIGSSIGTRGWGFVDLTNMYVVEGIHGGMGLLFLFLGLFVVGFAGIGKAIRAVTNDRSRAILVWALGVVLLMHAANFIGVAYFGQINVIWYLTLASIGSLVAMTEKSQIQVRRRVALPTNGRSLPGLPPRPILAPGRTPSV